MPEERHGLSERKRMAFEEVLRELETPLGIVARRLCGNTADANDLVQDTLERGLRNAHKLEVDRNPRAWLTTIMHNLFVDTCRKKERSKLSPDVDILHVPQPERDPEPKWARLTGAHLRAAAAKLEPTFRDVYELSSFDGLSYKEISDRLGIPQATVGTRLRRARQRLYTLLQEESQP